MEGELLSAKETELHWESSQNIIHDGPRLVSWSHDGGGQSEGGEELAEWKTLCVLLNEL